ncbi:beta-galactosidase [Solwaraspora sp. WMMD1047]|uniref:beta-galactosidase n=1 Tax=Solwaraspora sp. WMMD1047 TaxID=3016102 RepID=UPI002415F572|nr:beta-galactosidase [Solwaraspora sp. WMMD1047]MDG4831989.1 beta-galactosidase [Solwaraspora sp. WMMD1047]
MRWPRGLTRLCYGGDYNPEQWPEAVWADDVELMRRARVNLVTVGVFAWSRLEPAAGAYDFGWLDRVLDLLHDGGVRVALATPTASPPPWFSLAHPDALPVTADGVRLHHGSRDTYCPSAPAYRSAALRIAGALATRYRDHPALALWHVHNEYSAACHCAHSAAAFRRWLRHRHGDLATLNDAWDTSFWSQHYGDWEQIGTPRATRYLANPGHELDFRRFCSDELLAAYTDQRDLLRTVTPDVPVTTNYVLGGWVPVDHARWSAEVDLVAIDHYPSQVGIGAEEQTALAADLARSWARRSPGGPGWLLMESAPNLIYTAGRMHTKEPGRMARHSLAHVARGSRGAMFFQWRAPRGGAERFHSALVPHAGPDSRIFREAVALGATLDQLSEVDEGAVHAPIGIGWDAESWWALQGPGLPAELDYLAEVSAAHRALWQAGIGTDFVSPGEPLARWKMLVLPARYLVTDAFAAQLGEWVAAGGQLVVTYLSGVADEHGRVRLGGYPGALRDLLGIRVEEFWPLAEGETLTLSSQPPGATGSFWSETVRLAGAEPVIGYAEGPLAGQPAVTRHRVGSGTAWYVSTRLDEAAYRWLLTSMAATAGIEPTCPAAPDGVEAVRRSTPDTSWLFLFNHTDRPHRVPVSGTVLIDANRGPGELAHPQPVSEVLVPPGGVAVLREPSPAPAAERGVHDPQDIRHV